MDERMRGFLVQCYSAAEWLGRQTSPGTARNVNLNGSEVPGWILVSVRRNTTRQPVFLISVWRHGDAADELVSIRIIECDNAAATQEQMLEELSNFESPAIARRTGMDTMGDVAFGLGDTMVVFARADLVGVILNPGRGAVSVTEIARSLDTAIRQQLA